MVDAKPGRLQRGAERGASGQIALPLLLHVALVPQHGHHRGLDGSWDDHAKVLAGAQQLLDDDGVAGYEPGPVASSVGPLRQRADGEQMVRSPSLTLGSSTEYGSASQANSP